MNMKSLLATTKYVASRGCAGVSIKSVHTQAEQCQSASYT